MKNKVKFYMISMKIIKIAVLISTIALTLLFVVSTVLYSIIFISTGRPVILEHISESPGILIFYVSQIIYIAAAIAYLINRKKKKHNNPNLLQQEAIAATDERAINIEIKAAALSFYVIFFLIAAIMIITFLAGYLNIFYILFGIFCVSAVMFFTVEAYFKKKM